MDAGLSATDTDDCDIADHAQRSKDAPQLMQSLRNIDRDGGTVCRYLAFMPVLLGLALMFGAVPSDPAAAQSEALKAEKIENPIAVFAALDKVTARIKPLAILIGDTSQFGALKVTPRSCYTEPATEAPLTRAFVEVNEIQLDGKENRIFTGWMYAQSPGLHAVEHPVFDVWLTSCKTASGPVPADNAKKSPEPATASPNRR